VFVEGGTFDIPWNMYSEEEILTVVSELFRVRGYETCDVQEGDRDAERKVDLVRSGPSGREELLVIVRKKPIEPDVAQLIRFAKNEGVQKIYVYVREPTGRFKVAMSRAVNEGVVFWNADILSGQLLDTIPRLYMNMITEHFVIRELFVIEDRMRRTHNDIHANKRPPSQPEEPSNELLNLLWQGKDRAVSWNKALGAIQVTFERMKLGKMDDATKRSVIKGFLRGLLWLNRSSVVPLSEFFNMIFDEYPGTFDTFCKQTRAVSFWIHIRSFRPHYLPTRIQNTLSMERSSDEEMGLLEAECDEPDPDDDISSLIADFARTLGAHANNLEDVVDGLRGVVLFNDWFRGKEGDDYNEDLATLGILMTSDRTG
jgi:hypothetical protein